MTPAPPEPLALLTKADVASLLNVRLSQWTERRYRTFEIRRRRDGVRVIRAPVRPLKRIQATLSQALAPYYRPPHTVHGYVSDRSIRTNARVHQRQYWVLRVDLENFFPSINFGRVRGLFLAPPFSFNPSVATLLARICCHENELPQGAPTSPLISNLICRSLDRQLAGLASSARCFYTRYCDDLIFSINRRTCPPNLAVADPHTGAVRAGQTLREVIESHGFRINNAKTLLRKRTQRQIVTGLVVNEFVNVPRDYVRSVRALLHIWRRHGASDALTRLSTSDPRNRPPTMPAVNLALLARGKVQYVGSIKGRGSSVYRGLAAQLASLDQNYRASAVPRSGSPTCLQILVEGPTDRLHLAAALARFQQAGEFDDIRLEFASDSQDRGGDIELLGHCQALARIKRNSLVVCIFDRDNERLVGQVTSAGSSFRDWGNNVYSLAIPPPPHRDRDAPLCIELLYPDDFLRRQDSEGRRLYLSTEFDREHGQHLSERVYCTTPKKKSLIRDDDVYDLDTKAKKSLGKAALADAVFQERPPFEQPPISGFRPLFAVLQEIVNLSSRVNHA